MPGGLRQVLIHSEISFLRISVGCEANHFSASLAVATSCRAASMAALASLEGNARCVLRLYRDGTLSLYAALETRSGEILGKTAPRHTSAEFVDFWPKSCLRSLPDARSTSSPTISRLTKREARRRVPGALSPGPHSLYPHLFFVAEPSRDLVRQDPKAGHCPGYFFLRGRSPQKDPSLHSALQQNGHPIRWTYRQPNQTVARSSVTMYQSLHT